MSIKDIKSEARQKLPINIHQAIAVYLIEYLIYVTLLVLVLTAGLACAGAAYIAAAVIIFIYGVIMLCLAFVLSGVIGFSLADFYIASYRCKPYNFRRLADVVARNGMGRIIVVNLIRSALGFLLLLCLIVPGIIYLTRTSMANYLLNANPNMKPTTALSASNKVMSSKTGSYIGLMFSMLGWMLIGVVTLGIGFIFVMPYINMVKAVYYKRVLAGDKAVYNIPVQPVSPAPDQYQTVLNAQPVSRPLADVKPAPVAEEPKQPERPIQIDNPIPPRATLDEDGVQNTNDAMHEVGDAPHDDVPEIPITPPRTVTKTAVSVDPVSDSFVEMVKPLTTQEVDESHVFDKKVEEMFSGSISNSKEKLKNYMTAPIDQRPNDFVTQEVDASSTDAKADTPSFGENASNDAAGESVMSDAEFADFIRAFDVPTPESQFTPLKQRKKPDDAEPAVQTATEAPEAVRSEPSVTVEPQRPTLTTRTRDASASSFDRDRARREREERLRNLRRK